MDVLADVLPLALLDAVSVSTLLLPLWFLLAPEGVRPANVRRYLLLVAGGYLIVGVALLAGFSRFEDDVRAAADSAAGDALTAAVGVALILFAAWYGLLRTGGGLAEGRPARWRDAAVGPGATVRGLVGVAGVAVLLELPTMFPYLLAIDTLGDSDLPGAARVGVLAVYCLTMVAPAFAVAVLRGVLSHGLTPALRRVDDYLRRNEKEDTAWLLAIVGILVLMTTDVFDRGMELLDSR